LNVLKQHKAKKEKEGSVEREEGKRRKSSLHHMILVVGIKNLSLHFDFSKIWVMLMNYGGRRREGMRVKREQRKFSVGERTKGKNEGLLIYICSTEIYQTAHH
jgi:hypothetical protein